jgi:hypothetical protein
MPYASREDYNANRRKRYTETKQAHLDKKNRNRDRIRAYIRELKNKPCMDCGIKYPYYVMDFDHREGVEKTITPRSMVAQGWSFARIDAEVAKCDVVCANCHRERTHQRLQEEPND